MKPKTVYLVDKPVAAGLGLGINVKEAQGVLIVDIGAETNGNIRYFLLVEP